MIDRGKRRSFSGAALAFCLACAALASCASSAATASSSSPSMIELPPSSWPEGCPLVFVDSSGKPIQGSVKASSVRLLAFGLKALASKLRIEDDGSVSAASLSFDPFKGGGGGRLALGPVRLGPKEGDPEGGVLEYSSPDGWTVDIEGQEATEKGPAFRGRLVSASTDKVPGQTASSSAAFAGLLLKGKAKADWSQALVTEVEVLLDMKEGADSLGAGSAIVALDSGALSLSCELSLRGGAALSGGTEPGALVFPRCRLSGGGRISLPEASRGTAGFRLTGGFAVELSEASFSEGEFSCAGILYPPPEWKVAAPLSFPPGGILARSLRGLSLSTAVYGPPLEFSSFGVRIEGSGLSFAHAGKAKVSFSDAAIVAIGARREEGSAFRLPLGSLSMEDGLLKEGELSFARPLALPGYGPSLALSWIGWGPGGFRMRAEASLPGFLGAGGLELPELTPGSGGALEETEDAKGRSYRFLGSPYAIRGFRLLPGGGASLDSLLPAGKPKGKLSIQNVVVGADGSLFPDFNAAMPKLAGESDFKVTAISPGKDGGIRLSGSMTLGFASEGHIFSGRLETDDLRVSPTGEYGIGAYRWLKESVPAFLGLVFRKAEFAFRGSQAFLVLSEGRFAGGGAWPSGGEIDGLGLNLDTMKYDVSALRFPEPALLSRPEGSYRLSSFMSALDDAYLFAGTATLKALPGAPWKEGETLKVKLMRLDAYGNMRELKLERNGEEVDGRAWIKDK